MIGIIVIPSSSHHHIHHNNYRGGGTGRAIGRGGHRPTKCFRGAQNILGGRGGITSLPHKKIALPFWLVRKSV